MNPCAGSRDDLYVDWVSLTPKGNQSNSDYERQLLSKYSPAQSCDKNASYSYSRYSSSTQTSFLLHKIFPQLINLKSGIVLLPSHSTLQPAWVKSHSGWEQEKSNKNPNPHCTNSRQVTEIQAAAEERSWKAWCITPGLPDPCRQQ